MQCVASQAFAWRWRDRHNAVWNERASFEHGDRLQEVTIDMLTVPPIRTRSKGIIVTTTGVIVSINRGDISIGMARLAGTMVVLS